ncbi:choline dehydrogenase [Mesorhizobium sp. 113-3-9]|uniref:GMC family oxidoreductase n=1 Tax=Mesorhizobium sp. 113-3-9 TaxID=2744517 RepID=UPI001926D534|nr:GMC family oxidoreductase [Mesorhizobium sp. 113-3-9]BCG85632.1 choline dehydrogenase [Mesorhizobium sp. 113-3-9]
MAAIAASGSRAGREDIADVLIIGAGPSGSVAAKHLAQAGFKVVALEQGHMPDAGRYPGRRPEWELVTQKQWHPNPNFRDMPRDYPINTTESDVNPLMFCGVGGSATLYAGHWTPFMPSDFKVRTLDGIADDWPFTYEELAPHLEVIEREVGVSGLGGNPAYPPKMAYPTPALPIGKVGHKAAECLDRMGWHWWPGTNAIPSVPYNGLNACVRRGTCMSGCPEGAKSTTDLTHWPHAIKAGARLVTGARVREITVDERGLATGAIYMDENGRERRQRAATVILCANGIGTPRLLLLSKSARFRDGLANSSGLVGKRLMMHPFSAVQATFEEDLESWRGPFGQNVSSYEFYETDEKRGFLRGAKWGAMPGGGPLGATSFVGSKVFADPNARVEDMWGTNLHDLVSRRFGRTMVWGIIGEDLPEESNQVLLDPELTDTDGIPAPKLIYKVSENSERMLKFHEERCTEACQAGGAVEISVVHQMPDTGWHLLGTCVMGTDRETSVVNEWGQTHDVPNLFIFDGSTFPTSAGLNPTATIMSVALRQTRRMISERRNLEAA